MHAGSVRSNVCFESPYHESRYLDVMHGCGLDVDFKIARTNVSRRYSTTALDKNSDEADIGQVWKYARTS
jgi:hypothetical protein